MDRSVLRVFGLHRLAAAVSRIGRRAAMMCAIALFATGIWWIILYFGGRALGYPIEAAWMFLVLAGIFLLLVLGLSMAAMATSGTTDAPRDARKEAVAEPPQERRKAG